MTTEHFQIFHSTAKTQFHHNKRFFPLKSIKLDICMDSNLKEIKE